MIDKKIRPIYDDPWIGLYQGDPMDVTGHYLTEPLICAWLLEIMERQQGQYSLQQLMDFVYFVHRSHGGLLYCSHEHNFRRALRYLEDHKFIVFDEGADQAWCLDQVGRIHLPTFQEAIAKVDGPAKITLGDGEQSVYGWYLPTYLQMAEMKEEDLFPMKVGRTVQDPQKRMKSHIGTAPEQPLLGFELKVNDAENWEGWLHVELIARRRKIDEALGDEWFRTNPGELRRIVLPKLVQEDKERSVI